MKRIPLLKLPAQPTDALGDVDFAEIVRQVLRRPLDPQKGIDVDELRRGVRVLEALDARKAPEVLELEDADWEHLKEKTLAMPWATVDRRILQYVDAVLLATDQVPLNHVLDGVAAAAR